MKKKKTAAIVASVILCAAVVFSAAVLTGCGASGYFAEPEDAVYPTRAERIAELDGCAVGTGSNGTYVVTKQSGSSVQYGLYDFVGRRFVSPLGEGVITAHRRRVPPHGFAGGGNGIRGIYVKRADRRL